VFWPLKVSRSFKFDLSRSATISELATVTALFFADDITIKGNNLAYLEKALNLCVSWSLEARLQWGINKCGIVSRTKLSHPLAIGKDEIPIVDNYKYLGLPTGARGVRWPEYLNQITSKFLAYLRGTSTKKISWTYAQRLVIYKTFFRPVIEYCLPLLSKWIKKQKNHSKEYMEQLSTCHKEGLFWVFDRSSPRNLLECISGLGQHEFRIEQLELSLCLHLRQLHTSNPLAHMLNSYHLSASSNSIVMECKQSQLYRKWLIYKRDEKFPLKFKTWLKHEKELDLYSAPGILKHYIMARSRNRSGMDIMLTLPHSYNKNMLSWRCNRSFVRATCPICQQSFDRGHMVSCNIILSLELAISKDLSNSQYSKDISQIMKKIGKTKGYTLLDFYLNNLDYEKFLATFSSMTKLIYKDTG
jgi:hypothetical protein